MKPYEFSDKSAGDYSDSPLRARPMSATDTKETTTPRTDEMLMQAYLHNGGHPIGLMDFARRLERELNEAKDSLGTAWEKACSQRDKAETDLTAVTAQRDRALGLLERMAEQMGAFKDVDCICELCRHHEANYTALLAEYEALRKGER